MTLEDELRIHFRKTLRQVFYRSPVRRRILTSVRECVNCHTPLTRRQAEVDHTYPVVPVDRDVGPLEYFLRLFAFKNNGTIDLGAFSTLCIPCHRKKSREELAARARNRQGPYSQQAKDKARTTRERRKNAKKRKINR